MARRTKVEKADLAIARAAAPARRTLPVRILGWASELADQPQLISLCTGTLLAGLAARDPRVARVGARMLAAELLATQMKSMVKHRVDRTRPHVVVDGGDYALEKGDSSHGPLNSFPSGHTAGAVAVARAVARDYPARTPAACAAAATVAAVQIPRCRHYLTDIAAGAIVGLAAEWLVSRAFRAAGLEPHHDAPDAAPTSLESPAPLPISGP